MTLPMMVGDRRRHSARIATTFLLTLAVAVMAAACADGADGSDDSAATAATGGASATALTDQPLAQRWGAQAIAESVQDTAVQPVIVNSNIGLGPTRVAMALVNKEDQSLATGVDVEARFVWLGESLEDLSGASALGGFEFTPRSLDLSLEVPHEEASPASGGGTDHGDDHATASDGDHITIYTTLVDFDRTGWWGAEISAHSDSVEEEGMRITFFVQERTSEPAVGEQVPRSEQAVMVEGDDPADFTTANPPNPDLVDTTVAEAIGSGKPVVVAFVTPAFCVTRFCGPVLQAGVEPVYAEFRDQVEFIQIEPYQLDLARSGGTLQPVPAVEEWKLQAEPFVFVLAPGGTVAAKFEGVMDAAELRAALEPLVK